MAAGALGGAGGVLGAAGALRQGQATQAADQYNANLDDQNAQIVQKESVVNIARQQRSATQQIGDVKAKYSASGIDMSTGSAADIIAASTQQAALDAATLKYNADSKSYGLQQSAALTRYQGDAAVTASYYSAAGSLLGGAGKVAGAV